MKRRDPMLESYNEAMRILLKRKKWKQYLLLEKQKKVYIKYAYKK